MKRLMLLISILCSTSYLFAIDNITLKLGSITGAGWQTEGIVIQWHWLSHNQVALQLNIDALILAELKKTLQNIILICSRAEYNEKQILCPSSSLQINSDLLDKPESHLSFSYYFKSQRIHFEIDKLAIAGGKLNLRADYAPTKWQISLNTNKVDLDKFLIKINDFKELPSKLRFGGMIKDLTIDIFGDGNKARGFSINGETSALTFSNTADTTKSGENMAMKVALKAKIIRSPPASFLHKIKKRQNFQLLKKEKKYIVQGKLTLKQGKINIGSVHIDAKNNPVNLLIDLGWVPDNYLNIQDFTLIQPDIIHLTGNGKFGINEEGWKTNALHLQAARTPFQPFYTHYLQAELDQNSQWSQLAFSGEVEARLDWEKEKSYYMIRLYNISLEDKKKRFGLNGVHGKVQWHSHETRLPSHLHWDSAYIAHAIPLGASQLRANLNSHRITLLAPWYQPILLGDDANEGAIRIDKFSLENLGKENISWQLRGRLYPIFLSKLSTALKWLPLSGQLSGNLPLISYRNKQLKMDGKLKMRIFDGDIVINTLSLDKPFGNAPELEADIEITKINLKTLTETFKEFGEIQGQLSGYVKQLHLVDWKPVSFDAYIGTPEDDTEPHKISQKAIKNLSSLGGGAAANAISRSVLMFFEDFYYERIGWGCRLEKEICQMKGAGPALNGYYIIKGGWIPRIDIIGYEESVNWNMLISRIQTVIDATGNLSSPVVD